MSSPTSNWNLYGLGHGKVAQDKVSVYQRTPPWVNLPAPVECRVTFFKFTTADENGFDSPFEGGRSLEKASRDVSVPDWTVPSIMGQPPGSQG